MDLLSILAERLAAAEGPLARVAFGDGTELAIPIGHIKHHCALLRPWHRSVSLDTFVSRMEEVVGQELFRDPRLWDRAAWYLWMSYTLPLSASERAERLKVRAVLSRRPNASAT